MAVQKSKKSPSRRNMRRAHDRLSSPAWQECPDSGDLKRPHHVCLTSGMYKGRQVLQTKVSDDVVEAE